MKRQQPLFSMQKSSFLSACLLVALLSSSNCNAGWVDPDTPEEFLSTTAHFEEDTREYELVSYALYLSLIFISYISLRLLVKVYLMSFANYGVFSIFFTKNRCSLMNLNKMVAPLRMDLTQDGLLLIRMIVSCVLLL